MPVLCAIFQGDYFVGHAGIDKRLCANDAAGPAATIYHDHSVRRWHQVGKMVDELDTWHAYRSGDAVAVIFLVGPCVVDCDIRTLIN